MVLGEQLVVRNPVTGREVPILVNSAPLSDAFGIPVGGVAVFQDIGPLKDLERQKDEFLAAVSHDLKTPATIIMGRANLLQRALDRYSGNGKPTNGLSDFGEGLQAIDESTTQLVRLVDATIDEFGRLDILVNNAGGWMPRPFLQTSERNLPEQAEDAREDEQVVHGAQAQPARDEGARHDGVTRV